MIDVCPAITETLSWLPLVLLVAVFADILLVGVGAIVIRRKIGVSRLTASRCHPPVSK